MLTVTGREDYVQTKNNLDFSLINKIVTRLASTASENRYNCDPPYDTGIGRQKQIGVELIWHIFIGGKNCRIFRHCQLLDPPLSAWLGPSDSSTTNVISNTGIIPSVMLLSDLPRFYPVKLSP